MRVSSTRAIYSPDDGHMVAPKHVENGRKTYTKNNCASSW